MEALPDFEIAAAELKFTKAFVCPPLGKAPEKFVIFLPKKNFFDPL